MNPSTGGPSCFFLFLFLSYKPTTGFWLVVLLFVCFFFPGGGGGRILLFSAWPLGIWSCFTGRFVASPPPVLSRGLVVAEMQRSSSISSRLSSTLLGGTPFAEVERACTG